MFTEDRGMNGVERQGDAVERSGLPPQRKTFTEPSADLIKTTWMGPRHALSGPCWCVRELAWG